jgi:hypothetical protein
MRKHLNYTLGSAMVAAMAVVAQGALADVFVTATITKDKDVFVNEQIEKFKFVDIFVEGFFEFQNAAEAMAIVNVRNSDNIVSASQDPQLGSPPPSDAADGDPIPGVTSFGINLRSVISDSINDNTGLIGVNNDSGNISNQGNVQSFAVLDDLPNPVTGLAHRSFANAQAEVDQKNNRNFTEEWEVFPRDADGNPDIPAALANPNHLAEISGSINDNQGTVGVNNNAGNLNNQTNVLALTVGLGSAFGLTESALGQENTDNRTLQVETVKIARLDNSASFNTGVVMVNNAAGDMNNQGTAISFGALTTTAAVGIPGT